MSYAIKQAQALGLTVAVGLGLAGIGLVLFGGWLTLVGMGVLTNSSDSPVGFFGVLSLIFGACLFLVAKAAIAGVSNRLELSKVDAAACVLVAYSGGIATALAFWTSCSGTAEHVLAVSLTVGVAGIALAAFWTARPRHLAIGLSLGWAVVAIISFWWLTGNTSATGCPWYEPPAPTPVPVPTTTLGP